MSSVCYQLTRIPRRHVRRSVTSSTTRVRARRAVRQQSSPPYVRFGVGKAYVETNDAPAALLLLIGGVLGGTAVYLAMRD